MRFGLFMFPTDESIGPADLARAAEDHGFESLLFPEHTHIPVSRRTPYPSGGDLPREYVRVFDPFVALTAAAMATERLRVGTGICLVVERDPIVTAKEVATLDLLSGGRFDFGIGAGWNREEMANHGTDPGSRVRLMRERVEAMKAIWTSDVAEYHGEFVDLEPLWMWPKPVQQPHPPVLVGGSGPGVLQRVVDFGDEWMPLRGRGSGALADRIAELQELAAERGRGPIPVTLFGAKPDTDAIQRYAEAGVSRCLFWLPSAPAADVLPRLGRYAEVARRWA